MEMTMAGIRGPLVAASGQQATPSSTFSEDLMSGIARLRLRSLALLLLVAGVAGCAAPPPTEAPRTKLKVGYVPIADCLQLYVAVEQGMFAKNGLDVELTSLQSGQRIIEALIAGELQVGIANVVSATTAYARGAPIV